MGIPIVYRKSTERPLTSFDFIDMATGNGVLVLYGGETISGSYVLSTNSFYSNRVERIGLRTSSSSWKAIMTLKFDLEWGIPQIIKGDAIVNIPCGFSASVANPYYTKLDLTFHRVNLNGIEKQLVTVTTKEWIFSNSSGRNGHIFIEKLTIPNTKFKKGEKIRLEITLHIKPTSQAIQGTIAFDPANRNAIVGETIYSTDIATIPDSIDTILKVQLPVRINK